MVNETKPIAFVWLHSGEEVAIGATRSLTCSISFYGKILVLGTIQKNPSGYDRSITRSTKTCTLRVTSQPSTWRSSTEKITRTNRIYVHNWIFVLSHFDFPAQKRAAHLIRNCNFLLPPSIIVFTSRFICSDFGTGKFYGPLHNPIDSNFMAR